MEDKRNIAYTFLERKCTFLGLTPMILVCFLILALAGCNAGMESSINDEMMLPESSEGWPVNLLPREEIPDWLNAKIDELVKLHGPSSPDPEGLYIVFTGSYEKRTVYFILNGWSSCFPCEIYDENGKKINSEISGIKDWVVIWEMLGGVITTNQVTTRSAMNEDFYVFLFRPCMLVPDWYGKGDVF